VAKQILLGILVLLFLVNTVIASDIGYVVKTTYPINSEESSVIALLQSNGHNVSFLDDDNIINPDLYDLMIIGEDIANIEGLFDNKNHKTMFLSYIAAKNAGLSQYSGTTTSNKISIESNSNRITEDFNLGDLTVYSTSSSISYLYGCKPINYENLATKIYEDDKSIILLVKEDSLLLKDNFCTKRNIPISERNLFFGLSKASSWNSDSEDLFINSINWLIEGEDNDNDGYFYNDDCDDNNANKYQFIEGYLDSDNDGYGSEVLKQVCSGDNLPYGYSETNHDCDDTNENINPDATEIQYDFIDSDCDDSAELSLEIPDIEWNEDETTGINLNSYIWNPNNHTLKYYVLATSDDTYISLDNLQNFTQTGILNFSSQEDWHGEDWVVFLIVDNQTYLETNEIKLIVNPVNDAPEFNEQIENITWNEDTNLTNYLDLNDYFYDIDENELSFEVLGNIFISVFLDNGFVSFYPQENWFGSEKIIFSASDNEYTANSNEITLIVNDANEPPEFGIIDCETEINEDEEYSCELSATDFENNTFSFSISNENDLYCDISENELEYQSHNNYNGEADCLIRVSDDFGYNEYLLEINILPVNDAPKITDYSPKGVIRLMENINKTFSITASDIDGDDLEIQWFLDNSIIENQISPTYIFNKPKGNYELKAVVSDQELNVTKIFNVFVGSISDFTCQEVRGYVLAENQICLAELLGVKDIDNCCSIQGSPKFSETDRCKTLNNSISIEIKEPDEKEEFAIGETISFNIEVENNLEDDSDFDIRAYLYDLTDDNKIEDYKDSVDINQGDTEKISSEFEVSEDIDETHEFAIFVRAIEDKDEIACNEEYITIGFERQEHDVIIQNLDINPTELVCGDYLNLEVKLQNRGTSDEDVSIYIENTELKIKEQTPEFELEKYSDKDTVNKFFSVKLPENIKSGEYEIKVSANFDNEDKADTIKRKISIDCQKIEQKTQEIEKISLQTQTQKQESQTKNNSKIVLAILIMVTLFIILFIVYLFNLLSFH